MEETNNPDTLKIVVARPHHLKARLIVSLILLSLSIIGVFVAALAPLWAWHYWLYIAPVFAILCLWLSWHIAKKHHIDRSTVWHEILHWLALLLVVYFVSLIVGTGFMSSITGALFVLILLAFALILAGIHFDWFYFFIGLVLALLAVGSIYFAKYITIIILPLALIIAAFFIWRYLSKKSSEN